MKHIFKKKPQSLPTGVFSAKEQFFWSVKIVSFAALCLGIALALTSLIGWSLRFSPIQITQIILNNKIIAFYFSELVMFGALIALLIYLPKLFARKKSKTSQVQELAFSNQEAKLTGWLEWKDLALGVAGFVMYFFVFLVVSRWLISNVPQIDFNQKQELGIDSSLLYNPQRKILVFALLVVVAPILEEVFFRGYLFGKLRQKATLWLSILITSLLFAVLHGQVNVGIDTFVLSIFACLVVEAKGSLYPAVILHMLKNGLAFWVLFGGGFS